MEISFVGGPANGFRADIPPEQFHWIVATRQGRPRWYASDWDASIVPTPYTRRQINHHPGITEFFAPERMTTAEALEFLLSRNHPITHQ